MGGQDTEIQDHPYQVSLQLFGKHYCGGSVISENQVITAAHCFRNSLWYLTVRAGSSYHDKEGSVHQVESFSVHEKFVWPIYECDIAVVKVDPPFKLDETRRPIELFDEPVQAGAMAVVTGWGYTKPDKLQDVTIPIIGKEQCKQRYSKLQTSLKDGEICAGLLGVGGKDLSERLRWTIGHRRKTRWCRVLGLRVWRARLSWSLHRDRVQPGLDQKQHERLSIILLYCNSRKKNVCSWLENLMSYFLIIRHDWFNKN